MADVLVVDRVVQKALFIDWLALAVIHLNQIVINTEWSDDFAKWIGEDLDESFHAFNSRAMKSSFASRPLT